MKKIKLFLPLIILLTACSSPDSAVTNSAETSTFVESISPSPISDSVNNSELSSESSSLESTSSTTPLSCDEFLSEISLAIDGSVGKDDSIDNITLEDGDLHIFVTLGDPSPLSYEDLMISRTSSITDEILIFSEYYDYWEYITVDFGEHGCLQNGHDNIQDDGYGAYFIQENFIIQ